MGDESCGSTPSHPFGEPGKYDRVEVEVQDREACGPDPHERHALRDLAVRLREGAPLCRWSLARSGRTWRSSTRVATAMWLTVLTFALALRCPRSRRAGRQSVWPDRVGGGAWSCTGRWSRPDKVPADVASRTGT